jgi:hypothetical protein
MYRPSIEAEATSLRTLDRGSSDETLGLAEFWEWRKTMSIKSTLAVVATLTTLIAAPAFAIDQQASTEAGLDNPARVQATVPAGAYASAAPRGERFVAPTIEQSNVDFQAVGSH